MTTQHRLRSIAFPSISTGIFGFPVQQAAGVALGTVQEDLEVLRKVKLVRWVLWDEVSEAAYREAARQLGLQ